LLDEKTRASGGRQLTTRLLAIGGNWTVPAVEISAGAERGPKLAIVFGDAGRSGLAEQAQRFWQDGYRCWRSIAVVGESKIKAEDPDYSIRCSWPRGRAAAGIQARNSRHRTLGARKTAAAR